MSWEQRLKRVFGIERCAECGGARKIIATSKTPRSIQTLRYARQTGSL
jgi:hypothetical protein